MGTRLPTPGPAATVATAWAALSAAALGFVLAFGVNFPLMDEWAMLPILATPRPDPGWLWERHNEHLLPLPRLVYWAAFRATGDLRTGMFLSVLGYSLLAKLLLDAARAVRGRPAYADAFIPVALLNWSQYENLLMSYQVGFTCSTVLAGLVLRELALGGATTGRLVRVGLFSALLPLCGGHGLLLSAPGIAWLIAAGFATRRFAFCGGLALVVAVSASQYWWETPEAVPGWQPPLTGKSFTVGLLGFGSVGYGLAGWHLWPWLAVVPTVVAMASIWISGRAWRKVWSGHSVTGRAGVRSRSDRTTRERPLTWLDLFGLTAFLAGAFLLAAAIAWGRGRFGAFAVFFPRYTVLAALLPVAAYFLWLKFGGPRLARLGPAALAGAAVGLLPLNTWLGWADGQRLHDVQQTTLADLRAGVPVEVVAERTNFLVFNKPTAWAAAVESYAQLDLGRLTHVAHLPPVRTIRIDPSDVRIGPDGWSTVVLPQPRPVLAVRIRARYLSHDPHRPARFRFAWSPGPGSLERTRDDWLFRHPTNDRGDPSFVVWIDGPLAAFRFLPDAVTPNGAAVTAVELIESLGFQIEGNRQEFDTVTGPRITTSPRRRTGGRRAAASSGPGPSRPTRPVPGRPDP